MRRSRALVQERRYAWMRGDLQPAGPSGAGGAGSAPSARGAAMVPNLATPQQSADVWRALYALHALYEVCGPHTGAII